MDRSRKTHPRYGVSPRTGMHLLLVLQGQSLGKSRGGEVEPYPFLLVLLGGGGYALGQVCGSYGVAYACGWVPVSWDYIGLAIRVEGIVGHCRASLHSGASDPRLGHALSGRIGVHIGLVGLLLLK